MQTLTIAETKRIGTRTLTFILAFSAAVFIASGVSYAKPPPGAPLGAAACKGISGEWTLNTCTIPAGTSGVASSNFKIGGGITLDVKGGLSIPHEVTVTNFGTIIVENVGGVVPGDFDPWKTGILVYGALDNSGTITIQNEYVYVDETSTSCYRTNPSDLTSEECTEGITVSASVEAANPDDPSTFVVHPGTLANSGTIIIQNRARTRGIKNIGAINNSASGAIVVANSASTSVGFYNRRQWLGHHLYVNGTVTNAGSITISNSGNYQAVASDGMCDEPYDYNGYGIYNQGLVTNSDSGKFTINPSSDVSAAIGLYNAGNITSYGTFTNNRGNPGYPQTWGSFNHTGTMINYGNTLIGSESSPGGAFYNNRCGTMANLGTITSYGLMHDVSYVGTMINYGTIYNHGQIDAGVNHGLCYDLDGSGC